ncbi:MAG: EAL domain-containing protein [Acidimicrobiia bacterium]
MTSRKVESTWYLVRLRPAIIKIDMSVIHGIDHEPSKRGLVNGLKWLSDVLKSRIVAEGIERPEELDILTRVGVHYGQGYLLGRPGPLPPFADPTLETSQPPLPLGAVAIQLPRPIAEAVQANQAEVRVGAKNGEI